MLCPLYLQMVVEKDGVIGLFGRGLRTKILSNGLQVRCLPACCCVCSAAPWLHAGVTCWQGCLPHMQTSGALTGATFAIPTACLPAPIAAGPAVLGAVAAGPGLHGQAVRQQGAACCCWELLQFLKEQRERG